MNSLARIALTSAIALCSAGAATAQSVADLCPSPLKMADTGIEGMGVLEEAFAPFATAFQEVTGVELALYSLSNRTAAGTALQFDEVDFVFSGPSEFVLFQTLAPLDVLFSIERPSYGSSFVVKADSDIMTMADLKGRTVALKDVGSTSGHIFPTMMMARAGLDVDSDVKVVMAGDARIQVLINGDVDAMGGGNKDYAAVMKQDPDTEYRLLAESGRLPGDPVIMRASLPQDCRDALRATMSANADKLWSALTATENNAEKFLEDDSYMSFETDPAVYDMVREAYDVAGIALDD
ncbi:phosphate/phosphite/phosphonate ABC transporter substrate-binding protein [Szabonella alba]|uniref:Phosphate/phosphite/phosphonate ABC transporter substrate-binding protein n=1 Tax=Szabonella alba TaxID=2804194 RepID=A0A8K0VH06_9RHOB|nr:phosphate/phosphite/phosphonate ABC transporter substrate-binding protein [Szabonella alba]MBL4919302.1 phosphate/phosphite/phosphonate ABC transporter substrate-binding protein [Szabonella alba]